jgi:hypothetical protein
MIEDTEGSVIEPTTIEWLLASVRVPAQPSKHRVAVWRELRKIGAASVGQGVWTVPSMPVCEEAMARVGELARAGGGDVILMRSRGHSDADSDKLFQLFNTAREDDWAEFIADCGKFQAEIAREIAKEKFTMAELEEEEQSLERLRRWHHDLKKRDVFATATGRDALKQLRESGQRLDEYADMVYSRVQAL